MVYHETQLATLVSVDSLYTIHYFEYYRDYAFDGESHDFWEFLYIDKGEIAATCGGELIELHAGQAVLYRPLEFHALKANGVSAPNTIVISFASRSAALDSLAGRVIPITADARPVIGQILSEARMSFSTDLGDPCYTRLELRPEMERHIKRWKAISSLSKWEKNLDSLRTALKRRPEIVLELVITYAIPW